MDVRVGEALPHRPNELVHLAGRDALAARPDDVGRVDVAFERAFGRRTRGLVPTAAEECGDPAGHTALPEVDMGEQRAALCRLEAFVVKRVMDRVSADDADPEGPMPGRRLRGR